LTHFCLVSLSVSHNAVSWTYRQPSSMACICMSAARPLFVSVSGTHALATRRPDTRTLAARVPARIEPAHMHVRRASVVPPLRAAGCTGPAHPISHAPPGTPTATHGTHRTLKKQAHTPHIHHAAVRARWRRNARQYPPRVCVSRARGGAGRAHTAYVRGAHTPVTAAIAAAFLSGPLLSGPLLLGPLLSGPLLPGRLLPGPLLVGPLLARTAYQVMISNECIKLYATKRK